MKKHLKIFSVGILMLLILSISNTVFSHGNVTPQPVNTEGLENLGEEWKETNPYRGNALAIEIGSSAYNSNCARCHGLQAISGGIAPDLRELPWGAEGDEYFVQRVRNGAIRNGVTYMPSFEGIVSQEGLWTVRAWLDTVNENKPDDFKIEGSTKASSPNDAVLKKTDSVDSTKNIKERYGQEIVKKTCSGCHALGIANAPKMDPSGNADWKKRYANGMSVMMETVKKGKNGMPIMGGDTSLSDKELRHAITYMMILAGVEITADCVK